MNTCPVFRPNWEEFQHFKIFIEKIGEEGAKKGIVKIIPPPEWAPSKEEEEIILPSRKILEPINQSIKSIKLHEGYYHLKNSRHKSLNLEHFQAIATSERCRPPFLPNKELEKKYWADVENLSPIYGTDCQGKTLFRSSLKHWNINKLETILDLVDKRIPGVNTPYLYFGMWGSSFGWHTEDKELFSVSYLHYGSPKLWYAIPSENANEFEKVIKILDPKPFEKCHAFLRHKMCLTSPELLKKFSIPYSKALQEKGEIIITFPSSYHSGFNLGMNIAEAINFATPTWIPFGNSASLCKCTKNRVDFSMKIFQVMKNKSSEETSIPQSTSRKTRRICQEQNPILFARKVLSGDVSYNEDQLLEKKFINSEKGFGVFAKKDLKAGSFLCEYKGKLISEEEGEKLQQKDGPSSLYFFQENCKTHCIDGEQGGGIASFINDSVKYPNAKTVKMTVDGIPHICLFVRKEKAISKGQEILYDYGPDPGNLMKWRNGAVMPYMFDEMGKHYMRSTRVNERYSSISTNSISTLTPYSGNQNYDQLEVRRELASLRLAVQENASAAQNLSKIVDTLKEDTNNKIANIENAVLMVVKEVKEERHNFYELIKATICSKNDEKEASSSHNEGKRKFTEAEPQSEDDISDKNKKVVHPPNKCSMDKPPKSRMSDCEVSYPKPICNPTHLPNTNYAFAQEQCNSTNMTQNNDVAKTAEDPEDEGCGFVNSSKKSIESIDETNIFSEERQEFESKCTSIPDTNKLETSKFWSTKRTKLTGHPSELSSQHSCTVSFPEPKRHVRVIPFAKANFVSKVSVDNTEEHKLLTSVSSKPPIIAERDCQTKSLKRIQNIGFTKVTTKAAQNSNDTLPCINTMPMYDSCDHKVIAVRTSYVSAAKEKTKTPNAYSIIVKSVPISPISPSSHSTNLTTDSKFEDFSKIPATTTIIRVSHNKNDEFPETELISTNKVTSAHKPTVLEITAGGLTCFPTANVISLTSQDEILVSDLDENLTSPEFFTVEQEIDSSRRNSGKNQFVEDQILGFENTNSYKKITKFIEPIEINLDHLSHDEFNVGMGKRDTVTFPPKSNDNICESPEKISTFMKAGPSTENQPLKMSSRKRSIQSALLDDKLEYIEDEDNSLDLIKSNLNDASYKRPKRPCPICSSSNTEFSNLPRHLRTCHSNNETVKYILSLPKEEQRIEFDLLKKSGIRKRNAAILMAGGSKREIIQERRQSTDLKNVVKICQRCNGFFKARTISKHIRHCNTIQTKRVLQEAESLPLNMIRSPKLKEFQKLVLSSLSLDEIGNFILENELIQKVGEVHFSSKHCKREKLKSNISYTRQEMRSLTFLFLEFRKRFALSIGVSPESIELEEMFQRNSRNIQTNKTNFYILKQSIIETTNDDDNNRSRLYWILLRTCNALMGIYTEMCRDNLASELQFWKSALKRTASLLFTKSICVSRVRRENALRKPENLPSRIDIVRVREYVTQEIEKYTSHCPFNSVDFVHLRKVLLTRLTFLNGRRGGEVSRLTFQAYSEALNDCWINEEYKTKLTEENQKLFKLYKLTYVEGKGKRKVPVLIPKDCLTVLDLLCNAEIRLNAGVNPTNDYVFAVTGGKRYPVTGSSDIKLVMDLANVEKGITATQMRHYLSTKFANENQGDENLEYLSIHFGHDTQINKDVYQSPLAIQEITRVGAILDSVENQLIRPHTNEIQPTKGTQRSSNEAGETFQVRDAMSCPFPGVHSGTQIDEMDRLDETEFNVNESTSEVLPAESQSSPHNFEDLDEISEDVGDMNSSSSESELLPASHEQETTSNLVQSSPNMKGSSAGVLFHKLRKHRIVPRAQFTKEEETIIKKKFSKYIEDVSNPENKGKNPSTNELKEFLKDHPHILAGFTPSTKNKKIKNKCFNLRKAFRSRHSKCLKYAELL